MGSLGCFHVRKQTFIWADAIEVRCSLAEVRLVCNVDKVFWRPYIFTPASSLLFVAFFRTKRFSRNCSSSSRFQKLFLQRLLCSGEEGVVTVAVAIVVLNRLLLIHYCFPPSSFGIGRGWWVQQHFSRHGVWSMIIRRRSIHV